MPVDRFFHPRAGHSMKVASLTDFEFRVWWTYIVTADDFGIMRCSAVTIQAANDALVQQPRKRVDHALQRLVTVGLLLDFEHQERRYVCDPEWQKFQHIEYPKQTMNPMPPVETLAACHQLTQELFRQCFGRPSRKFRVKPLENSGDDPGKFSEDSPSGSRAREEANAKGLRLEASGKRQEASSENETVLGDSFVRVLDAFRSLWKGAYGHECSVLTKPIHDMQLQQQIAAHSEPKMLQALAAYFSTDDKFVKNARHPLAMFVSDPMKYLAKVVQAIGRDPVAETQADAEAVREILRQQDASWYGGVKR